MKKVLIVTISILLLLSLIGCDGSNGQGGSPQPTDGSAAAGEDIKNNSETAQPELIQSSYYEGQNSRAFKMIQKKIFQNLLTGWIAEDIKGIENPVWNFDSFAQYYTLNQAMAIDAQADNLYYCTFSADNNKFGYVIVSYDGDSLSRVRVAETPYLFDLKASLDDLTAALSRTELDFSSAVALRVQLADIEQGSTEEAIQVADAKAHSYICSFDEGGISVKEQPAAL